MEGGGGRKPQTDKTPAVKSLYRSFFQITTFDIAFYQSNLSTVSPLQLILTGVGGRGRAWSQIMRPQESLAFYV